MRVIEFTDEFQEEVIDLILPIQQDELGVKITVEEQPDLKNIVGFYQNKNGNFWIAIDENKIAGSIALVDIGRQEAVLRKMFVARPYRGKEKGVGQALLNRLFQWCRERNIRNIYLGTTDVMQAAHRFYEKNGFSRIEKQSLPAAFPVMPVDNIFYRYSFTEGK